MSRPLVDSLAAFGRVGRAAVAAAASRAATASLPHAALYSTLTHTDAAGKASMVDVGHKPVTTRTAIAEAWITLGQTAFALVEENKMKKGDVLTVAQLAGICGSKHTSLLIPLCHPIPISHAKVSLELVKERHAVKITAQVSTTGQTGVEMEALTAASVAALTVYDMCKAVTHDMVISDIALVKKTGGVRGDYSRGGV